MFIIFYFFTYKNTYKKIVITYKKLIGYFTLICNFIKLNF